MITEGKNVNWANSKKNTNTEYINLEKTNENLLTFFSLK
jgi:hypothetical protein